MGEVFANVLEGKTLRVAWVRVAFQDVSFDNTTAYHSNQLYLYSSLSRVVSVIRCPYIWRTLMPGTS